MKEPPREGDRVYWTNGTTVSGKPFWKSGYVTMVQGNAALIEHRDGTERVAVRHLNRHHGGRVPNAFTSEYSNFPHEFAYVIQGRDTLASEVKWLDSKHGGKSVVEARTVANEVWDNEDLPRLYRIVRNLADKERIERLQQRRNSRVDRRRTEVSGGLREGDLNVIASRPSRTRAVLGRTFKDIKPGTPPESLIPPSTDD